MEPSVAQHGRLQRGQPLQRRHRALGAEIQDKADCGVEHHDAEDDQGILGIADQPRNDCRGDQHQDHEVPELGDRHREKTARRLFVDLVRAKLRQAARRFFA